MSIDIKGFTNRTLDWKSWLNPIAIAAATPEQAEVLKESHPQATTSDYYLTLIHEPQILRERSAAYNAIMYAPGGLARFERELGATVVSRINGCVYCASVHAQRFEQLAKRNDVIAELFDDPKKAGTSAREKAVIAFSMAITERPAALGAADILSLKAAGMNEGEIIDLISATAMFGWANRLMGNLGEPVR